MTDKPRGVDSGKFDVDSRAYRQTSDPDAALRMFRMALLDQVSMDNQLPPVNPVDTKQQPQSAGRVIDLFSRNRLEL